MTDDSAHYKDKRKICSKLFNIFVFNAKIINAVVRRLVSLVMGLSMCVCVCVRVSPDCTHPTHLHGPPSSSYILLCSLLQLSDCRCVPFSVRVVAPVPIPHVSLVTSDLSSFLHCSWLESGFFSPFVYCLW